MIKIDLNDLKWERGNRKIWNAPEELDNRIMSSPGYRNNQKNMNNKVKEKLKPMGDPDKDGIPNWADKRPFIKDKNLMLNIMNRKSPLKKMKRFKI